MSLKKVGVWVIGTYFILAGVFYLAAGEHFRTGEINTDAMNPSSTTGELLKGQSISQQFINPCDSLNEILVRGGTYQKSINNSLKIDVYSGSELLSSAIQSTEKLRDNDIWSLKLSRPIINFRNKELRIVITSEDGTVGNAITFYYGNKVKTARADVATEIKESDKVKLSNSTLINGTLCYQVKGIVHYRLADYYWPVIGVLGCLLTLYLVYVCRQERAQKPTFFSNLFNQYKRYSFLVEQLVKRDFKTKYKRSMLGMCWSFLNPLLFMMVQYIVFSTLFKSSVKNFVVYLLIGVVCWGFFSEVTSMCLGSIVSNASLITKVYMPKYIYPLSRAFSSCVNFVLSLVPLVIVALITGTPIKASWILLVIPIVLLFLCSLGIGMILASMMVFFRDVQFLWGVVSTMLMYMTPIFYPDSIIPERYMFFYKLNPLYHVLKLFRALMINGVSPDPITYVSCFAACIIPLAIGIYVFNKTENEFVLYL